MRVRAGHVVGLRGGGSGWRAAGDDLVGEWLRYLCLERVGFRYVRGYGFLGFGRFGVHPADDDHE